MKSCLTLLILCFVWPVYAQKTIPEFLNGNWMISGSLDAEQWNIVSETNMKGFGYKMVDQVPVISEYLDISLINGQLILAATVLNQNEGKTILFKGEMDDVKKKVKFVNYDHDFPQEITYEYSIDSLPKLNVRIYGQGKEQYLRLYKPDHIAINADNPKFDAGLATKLGADDYGMKSYYFVVLKTGTSKNDNKEFINEAFKGHMNNINDLVKREKLIVAGPFGKNLDQFRGLFIFNNVKSEEEAKLLVESDPAVKAGLLSYNLYTWYGSAALPMYLPYSYKITKSIF
ncbi:YciI family protein [Sphingobacterium endophyticum]|uniref:YciI family protein n=1 Tax=Sphingobacterium endophyticum TaxID=2546448 RepID=UPI0018CE05DF|nr:hypothetical protein [Sphingobacterium endophyticum]